MKEVNLNDYTSSLAREYDGKAVVYRLTWAGLSYIGSTVKLLNRLSQWKQRQKGVPTTFSVLLTCEPEDKAYYEEKCIATYDTFHHGHNKDGRGVGAARMKGHKKSEESKRKMSLAKLAMYADKANHPRTGKPVSEQAREKMSAAHKGIPLSSAHKQALKDAKRKNHG